MSSQHESGDPRKLIHYKVLAKRFVNSRLSYQAANHFSVTARVLYAVHTLLIYYVIFLLVVALVEERNR